jgi:hypothetical protein
MMLRLAHAAAVAVLAATGGSALVAAPAQAAGTAGYCPDGNGVTVVVDFNDLGGGVVIRCAPGDQATGLDALKNAGFAVAGTVHDGPGFVCRIEGKPAVASEPCVKTPPLTAYWTYWHAPNGGAWAYSQLGVANRKPPLGSFEGWSFSTNRTEATAPRPDTTPTRPAPPPPPPANGGGGAQPGGAAQQPGGAQPGATQPGATPPGATTGAPTPGATSAGPGDPGGSATEAAPAGSASDSAPLTDVATRPTASSGMPTGTLAGLGLLVAFAAAAGFTVWWRRRSASEGS